MYVKYNEGSTHEQIQEEVWAVTGFSTDTWVSFTPTHTWSYTRGLILPLTLRLAETRHRNPDHLLRTYNNTTVTFFSKPIFRTKPHITPWTVPQFFWSLSIARLIPPPPKVWRRPASRLVSGFNIWTFERTFCRCTNIWVTVGLQMTFLFQQSMDEHSVFFFLFICMILFLPWSTPGVKYLSFPPLYSTQSSK